MDDDPGKSLSEAVEGLLYPSERDAPIEVMRWPGPQARTALELVKKIARRRRIQPVDEAEFFASLSKTDDADRFAQLRRVFEEQLADRGVFRVGAGETSVDIYLLGRDRQGDWAALHTVSIET